MPHPLYIVSHIPKTAGSTLRCNFELNFSGPGFVPADVPGGIEWDEIAGNKTPQELKAAVDESVRRNATPAAGCIFGHWAYYSIHEVLSMPVEPRYITFMREPIARVVSMYRYNSRTKNSTSFQEIQQHEWSLEEWYERSDNNRRKNGQVRHLLMGDHADIMQRAELSSADLAEAKKRLRAFWFVGHTETFTDDSAYLYGKLGFTKFLAAEAVNVSEGKAKISDAQRELLSRGNELDLELYALGQELREQNVARAADFAAMVEQTRKARSRQELRQRVLAPVKKILRPGQKVQGKTA